MTQVIHTFVIPCGGEKTAHAAPARDLYVGQMFKNTLAAAEKYAADRAAEGQAVQILILSAKHGLLDLDTVVEPYDCEMMATRRKVNPASIKVEALVEQLAERGLDGRCENSDNVWAMLPAAYNARLDAALRVNFCALNNVYDGADGIGFQRGVNRCVAA